MQGYIYITQSALPCLYFDSTLLRLTSPYLPSQSHRIRDVYPLNVVPVSLFDLPGTRTNQNAWLIVILRLPASSFSPCDRILDALIGR